MSESPTFHNARHEPFQFEPVDASRAGSEQRRRKLTPMHDWFKRGTIDRLRLLSAQRFENDYLESLVLPRFSSMQIDRVDGGGGDSDAHIHRQRKATAAHLAALAALPERCRPVVMAVIGESRSIRDLTGGGGAQGGEARALVMVGLDCLLTHYVACGVVAG